MKPLRTYRDRAALLGALALCRCIGALNRAADKLIERTGYVPDEDMFVLPDGVLEHKHECPECGGAHYVGHEPCAECNHAGYRYESITSRMILSGEFDG